MKTFNPNNLPKVYVLDESIGGPLNLPNHFYFKFSSLRMGIANLLLPETPGIYFLFKKINNYVIELIYIGSTTVSIQKATREQCKRYEFDYVSWVCDDLISGDKRELLKSLKDEYCHKSPVTHIPYEGEKLDNWGMISDNERKELEENIRKYVESLYQ